ncbi:ABC transporter ATP-binding protein [Paenibacillus sp. FSL L8-0463]|uniref:ABC transporter ATP-binding protein n=1 Tax=Paenibacillus sp. FSL L8-0463 TaxID=2954687 RepID=UPI003119B2F5
MSYNNKSITINNISKMYKMYDKPQDRLKQFFYKNRKKLYREFWALNDVSFSVSSGTTLGIIGRNGSGKSTLLQIIAGTLQASSGTLNIKGRIAALLELGSGFNPEFTGRENVYLNGSIMGLSEKEMKERMPIIEQFAEIGEFIDQPVKLYSSGMYVRLAFACAVNVDPDILIIDEALAVGDMQFQLKCMDKMKKFKEEGKTILFVSHDTYSVKNFCDEVIWMKDGRIYRYGDVLSVTNEYEIFMRTKSEPIAEEKVLDSNEHEKKVLLINNIRTKDGSGKAKETFSFKEDVYVEIEYTLKTKLKGIVGGVAVTDQRDAYICGVNTKLDDYSLPSLPGNYTLVCKYDQLNLLPGTYYIDVGFFESAGLVRLDYKTKINSFSIQSADYIAEGIIHLDHSWTSGGAGSEI